MVRKIQMSTVEYLKFEERKQVLTQNQKAGYAKGLLLYSLIIKYFIDLLTIFMYYYTISSLYQNINNE
ncbi:MAG: hypothetical protein ACR5K3_05340 [Wolbachia sp.]